ncbi:hypothetical protein TNCV_397611 [Trichonephila clavipes]|nr:hypothetical protein TNCV_397611 [Trichonephila clavipes]
MSRDSVWTVTQNVLSSAENPCSITARIPGPTTLDELKSPLVLEWVWLPQGLISTLVNSMKHQCENSVAVKSDHTPS